jgi:hypothetical protein
MLLQKFCKEKKYKIFHNNIKNKNKHKHKQMDQKKNKIMYNN